jgi:hypothetical protein
MAVIATQGGFALIGGLIKLYDCCGHPELFNDVLVVNTAAIKTIPLGTVLGKVTATGKYIPAVETAVDGSKVAAAIYIGDSTGAVTDTVTVAATDTNVLALVRGKVVVSKDALVLDATYDDATKKGVVYASLKALGILVETTI